MLDRYPLHVHHLADQAGQVRQRTSELPGVGVGERLLLLIGGPLVDEHHDLPAGRGEHVAGDLHHVDQRKATDVDPSDRSPVEVVGDECVARSPVRVLAHPARAQHPARAGLEQGSLQVVDDVRRLGPLLRHRHGPHPFRHSMGDRRRPCWRWPLQWRCNRTAMGSCDHPE